MNRNLRAYLELALAMILLGSYVVVGKVVIETFPIFLASALRLGLASLVLILLLFKMEKGFPVISHKDYGTIFLQSFTGVFLFNLFLLYGLRFTTASESGIITSTTPAVISIIAFLFLKEKLTYQKQVAILLVVSGILLIHVFGSSSNVDRGLNPLLGNLLILGAVFGEACMVIFGKVASQRVTPLAITTLLCIFGTILFLPFALYEAVSFDFTTVAFIDWLLIGYFGIVLTVIVLFLWNSGISKVPTSTVSVFTGILPVSAVLLSYLVLKEPFLWSYIFSILLVVIGIFMMTRDHSSVEILAKINEPMVGDKNV
jgi:drug/metabolite transporter (DMT)-like permease